MARTDVEAGPVGDDPFPMLYQDVRRTIAAWCVEADRAARRIIAQAEARARQIDRPPSVPRAAVEELRDHFVVLAAGLDRLLSSLEEVLPAGPGDSDRTEGSEQDRPGPG